MAAVVPAQVAVYVDGFNLYHAIAALGKPKLKWLSLRALALSLLRQNEVLRRVCYFTAVQQSFPEKAQRHRRYINALQATGVEVHLSRFQKTQKHCVFRGAGCNFHEEKQTDVRFSSQALSDAYAGHTDRFILLTADSDQVPTAEVLKVARPGCVVSVVAPPGRLNVARELGALSDTPPVELSEGRLAAAVLPRNVYDASGKFVAACPAEYVA